VVDKLIALGIISVLDLEDVGAEPLVKELKFEPELAKRFVEAAKATARKMAAESRKNVAENLLKNEAGKSEGKESV